MAHFAKLNDEGNEVVKVHCLADHMMLDSDGNESEQVGVDALTILHGAGIWVQTSKSTHGGKHDHGGTPLRANYAGRGYVYDKERDVFYPKCRYPSWILNLETFRWNPPVPYPKTEYVEGEFPTMYRWNEDEQKWDEA